MQKRGEGTDFGRKRKRENIRTREERNKRKVEAKEKRKKRGIESFEENDWEKKDKAMNREKQ